MGEDEPDAGGRGQRRDLSLQDLERWEESGATWTVLELSDDRAVLELCTCYGEPVDRVQSDAAELIAFVRRRRAE